MTSWELKDQPRFQVCTLSYGQSFSCMDLWPSGSVQAISPSRKKLGYVHYCTNYENNGSKIFILSLGREGKIFNSSKLFQLIWQANRYYCIQIVALCLGFSADVVAVVFKQSPGVLWQLCSDVSLPSFYFPSTDLIRVYQDTEKGLMAQL